MEYDNWQPAPRPRRSLRWLWLLVACTLLLGASTVLHLVNFPAIRVEKTADGFALHLGKAASAPRAQDADSPETQTEPNAPHSSGQTISVDAALPGAEYLTVDGGMSLQDIYASVIPSVVTITTQGYGPSSLGTGIIMSADGYIITNQHVVDNAGGILVQLTDDTTYEAVLIGGDLASDLAVLKIDAQNLTAASFGDSDSLRVGDLVVAIGNPIGTGLRGTMTDGIISGISRDLMVGGRKMTLLQTNAALNSGNSGGPLINCYGQVVGVCTVKLTDSYRLSGVEGLGFAIPMNTAKPIVDELISRGYVSGRGALGITVEELPLRARLYFGLPEGAHVKTVDPTSDAWDKGLQPGDIITAFQGQPVSGPSALSSLRNYYSAGETVTLTIFRGGSYYDLDITLMEQVTDE